MQLKYAFVRFFMYDRLILSSWQISYADPLRHTHRLVHVVVHFCLNVAFNDV